MSDIKDQKKLTDGKGWGAVEWARESPYKVVKDVAKKVKDIAQPFIEESVAIKHLLKKDKKKESKYIQKKKD